VHGAWSETRNSGVLALSFDFRRRSGFNRFIVLLPVAWCEGIHPRVAVI
jgi:hypothetical protein